MLRTHLGPAQGANAAAAGSHDYDTPGASGYFIYFGSAAGDADRGYYSDDLGAWHVVVLNSETDIDAGSPQLAWLAADLDATDAVCTVAYWHQQRFSSGQHGSEEWLEPAWQVLYDAGADLVITGLDHHYERFAPQTPSGVADPEFGIREFVVGIGGRGHRDIGPPPRTATHRDVWCPRVDHRDLELPLGVRAGSGRVVSRQRCNGLPRPALRVKSQTFVLASFRIPPEPWLSL